LLTRRQRQMCIRDSSSAEALAVMQVLYTTYCNG
jgi:hypothetical protein